MPRLLRLLSLVLVLAATSCHTLGKLKIGRHSKKAQELDATSAKAIGTIEMVNPEAGFVIVHTLSNVPVAAGTELTTLRADGQSAKLKVTPEHKSIFITADVVSGTPHKGDTVMQGASPAPAAAATPASTTPASGAPLAPVAGIPEANLLRSASPPPPGGVPGRSSPSAADTLPLPVPQGQNEYLRVVPSGPPRNP